jgi:hypothetical protein
MTDGPWNVDDYIAARLRDGYDQPPCLAESEPWDVGVAMRCQRPKGHDGYHSYTAEWDASGEFVGGDDD